MGKVDRLRNIIELFCCLVLCSRHCTLYNVQLYNTYLLTPGPARWPGINAPPYTTHFLTDMVTGGSILSADASAPPFPI